MVSYVAWQQTQVSITLFTDSDWATDPKTRKLTSGGVVMLGSNLIGHCSRVQSNIALSSGEAELNSGVKGISEIIGFANLSS